MAMARGWEAGKGNSGGGGWTAKENKRVRRRRRRKEYGGVKGGEFKRAREPERGRERDNLLSGSLLGRALEILLGTMLLLLFVAVVILTEGGSDSRNSGQK